MIFEESVSINYSISSFIITIYTEIKLIRHMYASGFFFSLSPFCPFTIQSYCCESFHIFVVFEIFAVDLNVVRKLFAFFYSPSQIYACFFWMQNPLFTTGLVVIETIECIVLSAKWAYIFLNKLFYFKYYVCSKHIFNSLHQKLLKFTKTFMIM